MTITTAASTRPIAIVVTLLSTSWILESIDDGIVDQVAISAGQVQSEATDAYPLPILWLRLIPQIPNPIVVARVTAVKSPSPQSAMNGTEIAVIKPPPISGRVAS